MAKRIFTIAMATLLLASCSNSSASKSESEQSVCTTLQTTIQEVEDLASSSLISLYPETRPSSFELANIPYALEKAGITYDNDGTVRSAVEKFIQVAGMCLSEDANALLANY